MPDLHTRVDAGVLRLTLDRPDVGNALTGAMADDLAAALEAAGSDDAVRVVVLAGAGAAFCTGADLGASHAREELDVSALDRANRIIRAVVGLDQPVVAAVDGIAAGVGCSIALAADLVVASRSASFLLAFARVGLMPDGGSSATVATAIGRARAMRMALLAEPLSAEEALAAGLVAMVAPEEEHADTVERVVRRLAAGPPLALAGAKKAINAATLPHLEDALERERRGQAMLLGTADATEGIAAFTERRRPHFRGE